VATSFIKESMGRPLLHLLQWIGGVSDHGLTHWRTM
jgi:hypothetical protein